MRWIRRGVAAIVLLLVVLAALAAALCVFRYLPPRTSSIALIVGAAICAVALVSWGGAQLDARIWRIESRAFAVCVSFVVTAAVGLTLYTAVLKPSPFPHIEPVPRPNTRYWSLPTGSRIAYSEYDPPAGSVAKPEPILFLHGGPGVFAFDLDHDFYKQFAADGFRVFIFDQEGSGLSGKLPHAKDYSLERAVADLEEIRRAIGAPRIILIGHSWGATLAANYMAKYPEHVTKVVFHSPGAIWNWDQMEFDFSRTDAPDEGTPTYRFDAAALLFMENPDAGENLVSQREAGDIDRAILRAGSVVCRGETAKRPIPLFPSGFNPYLDLALYREFSVPKAGDPHEALRQDPTPAMVAYSECDFLSWQNVLDYRNTFPDSKIFYIPRAGHYIYVMQPDLLASVIRSFLLDRPDAIPPYKSDADPRPANSAAGR